MNDPNIADIYDLPEYYDIIFADDWESEFEFLRFCFDRYVDGPAQRLLEPACGTGRLLVELDQAGYDVAGVELNAKMARYCHQRCPSADLLAGDMSNFQLAQFAQPEPFDAGFNMINSVRHLLSEQKAVSHFRCMADVIRPGGIYVVGLHLTPTIGDPLEEETWVATRDDVTVTCHLETYDRDLDSRIERASLSYDIAAKDRDLQVTGDLSFRTYTAEQMEQTLQTAGGWEIAQTYDFTYDQEQPIVVSEKSEDVVYVLKRIA
ncbi:class I SAM-dependent methyltransferase [Blastopirellula sp. JC732]|uniref:Class I SAM-dependent methyltransferase n=1 Tax=Blastopirellula sediminis TaxID=2894196 RepID=A0A9X1MPF5_9BACT|nr:class I SAM-dependent methyltransferase [Blastopirellula sediminis]MCC9607090.1 class I SAM-dependent methyltransferase [Blastopirellula sediminis]MCC9629617.1 class I SAM-dependent methyltransferase [Blastopirellula sediminis]